MNAPQTPDEGRDDARLDHARQLAAAVIPEDIADATPEEDLRDYGLDSIRIVELLSTIESEGGRAEFADLVGSPTLTTIAAALPAGPKGQ